MRKLEALLLRAGTGDAAAQFEAGRTYHHGLGVKPYPPSAIAWYFKAASQGHVDAEASLGAIFFEETVNGGAAGDPHKAKSWLLKAAAQGSAEAMYQLGVLEQQGYCGERDPPAARDWFLRALEKGHAPALNRLGLVADEAGDHAGAAAYFRRGAERGDVEAQFNLATAFRDGSGVGRDDAEAEKWFRAAAEQGLAEAQYALGMLLLGGGIARRQKEAQRWLQQAATQGHVAAQYEAAEGFRRGRGTAVDASRTMAFYRMAADQGHLEAAFGLGVMFEPGTGFRGPKLADAAAIYRRAAKNGHALAAHQFGLMLARGAGVAPDRQRAREVLAHAIALGADEAMASLGQLLMNDGDLVGAAQWAFIALRHQPEGQGQKLLEAVRAHLPHEGLAEAERRARKWKRRPVEIAWDD
jgi:hypothetical protein